MGSLFRVREWSALKVDDEEGFDCNSLLVCNIDNADDGEDKIIVGSLTGILRLYKNKIDASNTNQQLLLEADLGLPILALASGRLLPSSDSMHLLILHPRKVCVYSASGIAGLSEHGCSHNILMIYEHILQHSAYNVVVGPFGQIKGKDCICVQSLDGTLSFFEQETFTFSRLLPDHLLPGPMDYCARSDSFIVATSSKKIESYRYQIIAIAKESENMTREGQGSASRGRKVVADWDLVLGETVIDLKVVAQEKRSSFIVALGERNLFVVGEDGSPIFVKKFDFSPMSMHPFMNGELLMTLIVTEFSTLLCFAQNSLKWAAQMSFAAVAIRRAQISGVAGVIVALSDSGDLSSCYLGTNPSLALVSVATEQAKIDYEQAEMELQELRKTIRAFQEDGSGSFAVGKGSPVGKSSPVRIEIAETDASDVMTESEMETSNGRTCVTYKIMMSSEVAIDKVRLTIDLPMPLKSNRRTFATEKVLPNAPLSINFMVFAENDVLPVSLTMRATAVFYNEFHAPRVVTRHQLLPLRLVAHLSPIQNDPDDHCISLGVVSNNSVRTSEIFSDMVNMGEEAFSDIGFNLASNPVAISTQAKGSQCKVTIKSGSFPSLAFVAIELILRLRSLGLRFDPALLEKKLLPLKDYFPLIQQRLDLRHEIIQLSDHLSEQSAQFRTIEKRFLVKLKDRNPAPAGEIEQLIAFVHSRILETTAGIISVEEKLCKVSAQLASLTTLLIQMLSIMANMKSEQMNQIRALLSPPDGGDVDQLSEGWEERTEAALLDFLGPLPGNELTATRFSDFQFSIADDSLHLQDLITRLIDSALRRDMMAIKSTGKETSASPPLVGNKTTFVHPATEIIHEEEEGDEDLRE